MPTVVELVERARALGLVLTHEPGGRLRVRGPDTPETRAVLEELRQHKAEVLQVLTGGTAEGRVNLPAPSTLGPLASHALSLGALPPLRFTLRETEDEEADARFMARVAELLREFPGQQAVVMTVVALDGRRRRFLWRAEASRSLRFALARLLRERALARLAMEPPHGPAYCLRCQPISHFETWPYRVCRRRKKLVMVRHVSDPSRHLLRLPEPSVCIEEAIWGAHPYDALVVQLGGRGWGWQWWEKLAQHVQVVDRGHGPQVAVPLRLLRLEWWQPGLGENLRHAPSFRTRLSGQQFPDTPRVSEQAGLSERNPGVSEQAGLSEQGGGLSEQGVSEQEFPNTGRVSEHDFPNKGRVSEQAPGVSEHRCPACGRELAVAATGRPRRWCSDACRMRAKRKGRWEP